jgi:hypothetical protein
MWFIRSGRAGRWEDNGKVEEAEKDLTPDDDGDPSVFRVERIEEAHYISELFSLTCKIKPQSAVYILLPEACFESDLVERAPDEELHPCLSARHYEIRKMSDSDVRRSLAARIKSHADKKIIRVTESLIKKIGREWKNQPEIQIRLTQGWRKFLGMDDC